MKKDINKRLTETEKNQNFSDSHIDLEQSTVKELTDDEKIDIAAKYVLERYRSAFIELAKY